MFDQRRSTRDIQRIISDVSIEVNLLASSPKRSGLILAMGDECGMGNYIGNVTIRNNISTGNNHLGIAIGSVVHNVRVYNNTFYKNGRQGITIYDEPTRASRFNTTYSTKAPLQTACPIVAGIKTRTFKRERERHTFKSVTNAFGPTVMMGVTDSFATAGAAWFAGGDGLDFHL